MNTWNPKQVGNKRRVLVSDLSGKSNVEYKAKELGVELGKNGFDSSKIASEIKQLEQEGATSLILPTDRLKFF